MALPNNSPSSLSEDVSTSLRILSKEGSNSRCGILNSSSSIGYNVCMKQELY